MKISVALRMVGQQQNLNLDIVRALIVSAPSSSDEQHEIVEILDAVNLKIDLHKRKTRRPLKICSRHCCTS